MGSFRQASNLIIDFRGQLLSQSGKGQQIISSTSVDDLT
jgi:hypothetical protein